MHILFLTDNFPPETNAPATRTYEHTREWVKAGHQVTVITCAPNFPKGQVFAGYRNRLWQRETIEGIQVIRVWSYITANEGFLKRTLDYMSFMVTGFLASLFVRKVDVVIGTSPQFFTVCAAYVTSLFKRVPWVFELRDLWPETITMVGALKNQAVISLLERLELFLYRKSDLIVSVTNSFKEDLAARGIDATKITVITNGVDINLFRAQSKDLALRDALKLKEKFVIGYLGTLGMCHKLDVVLEAASLLNKDQGMRHVQFVLIGDGADKRRLVDACDRMGLANVSFVNTVARDQVLQYWSVMDLALVHLAGEEGFKKVIPSKIFEAMSMGVPILHGVKGESAAIVEENNCGIVFEPENASDLCQKITQITHDPELLKKMTESALNAVKKYDREFLALKMLEGLKDVVSRGKKK
jgi:hypothetical protein